MPDLAAALNVVIHHRRGWEPSYYAGMDDAAVFDEVYSDGITHNDVAMWAGDGLIDQATADAYRTVLDAGYRAAMTALNA